MATEVAEPRHSPGFSGDVPQALIEQDSGNIAKNVPQVSSLYKFLKVLKDIGRPVRTFRRQPTTTTTTAQTELDSFQAEPPVEASQEGPLQLDPGDQRVEPSPELTDGQPVVAFIAASTNQCTKPQPKPLDALLPGSKASASTSFNHLTPKFKPESSTIQGEDRIALDNPTSKNVTPSLRRGIAPFEGIGKNLYEATRLRPEASLLNDWEISWQPTLKKRLKALNLGQHITNMRLSMVGDAPDAKSMKPTILLICGAKIKEVENGLSGFIKISIPSKVDFKVTEGRVKLAAGEASDVPLPQVGERTGLVVKLRDNMEILSLMGVVILVQSTEYKSAYFPACTLGGVVLIGGTFYALTVAHSIFRTATGTDRRYTAPELRTCGLIESYEWSGNKDLAQASGSNGKPLYITRRTVAADWMLIRLREEFVVPNLFKISDSDSPQEVSGFFRNSELSDDEVWVCGGITGTQIGLLNTTPSSILFGQVSYDVLSIALEFPLADGDSGSWVIRDHKVCGYIFARLDGERWAYMMPIEPVFEEISIKFSLNQQLRINVPGTVEIKSLRSKVDPTTSSTLEPSHTPVELSTHPPIANELSQIEGPVSPFTLVTTLPQDEAARYRTVQEEEPRSRAIQGDNGTSQHSLPLFSPVDLERSGHTSATPIFDQALFWRWGPLILDWRLLRQIYVEKGIWGLGITVVLVFSPLSGYISLITFIVSINISSVEKVFACFGGTLLLAFWAIFLCNIIYRVNFTRLFRRIRSRVHKWLWRFSHQNRPRFTPPHSSRRELHDSIIPLEELDSGYPQFTPSDSSRRELHGSSIPLEELES